MGNDTAFVFNTGSILEASGTINVTSDRIWRVGSSGMLRALGASVFKFSSGAMLFVNGKLIGNGSPTQRIAFTSGSASPAAGDWQGIVCSGGGPDTLQYCDIKYATSGLRLGNTLGTSYIFSDTISSCALTGLSISNTGTGTPAARIYKCGFRNNGSGQWALGVNNARVNMTYCRLENNSSARAVWVGSAGVLFMDSCRVQNDLLCGIEVSGVNSKVSLSPDDFNGGYNTVYQHGAMGEVYIHGSATAVLGYPYEALCCDCGPQTISTGGLRGPDTPCPPQCVLTYCEGIFGGYNNISNTFSYSGRLVNFANPGTQEALRNYWYYGGGSTAGGGLIGDVDTSFALSSAVSTPSKTIPVVEGDMPLGVNPDLEKILSWITRLEQKVESNTNDAADALYHLAALIGPGGAFANVRSVRSWTDILSLVKSSSPSPRLIRLAKSMEIQDRIGQGDYTQGVQLADQLLSQILDDDTWLYCQTRKIFSFVGMGDLGSAQSIFAAMQARGRMIDTTTVNAMHDYLLLASKSLSGVNGQSQPVKNSLSRVQSTPTTHALLENYPNPFNPTTSFRYQIATAGQVTLKIYDVLGREVAKLVDEDKLPGEYNSLWDASVFSSGIYFYKLQAGTFSEIKKMLLIR